MSSEPASSKIYRFGIFEANSTTGELLRRGVRVKVQEQPFYLLLLLLENAGEIVSRDGVRQRLWPGNTFVEFDSSLSVAVGKIRNALGDDADNPRFIETVPRRGYRFIAPLKEASDAPIAGEATAHSKLKLAVLPFTNMGSDPEQEYFSDGLTEELIVELSRLDPHRIGVIARMSVMKYRHTTPTVDRVLQELGADYILVGSVRR